MTIKPLGTSTLVLRPEVGYKTQTSINPYVQADINHLNIKLFNTSDQDLGISLDLPNAQLGNPIAFSHLKNNTIYRVRPFAYASSGTAQCISTSSYVDVVVGIDDRPSIATLSVNLIDKPFNGQATASGIVVASGSYSLLGPEGMGFPLGNTPVVTTFAGSISIYDYVEGNGVAARFHDPYGVAVDAQGNVLAVDTWNHAIRKITSSGSVSTFAGGGGSGLLNGTGTAAKFYTPIGIGIHPITGDIFVADTYNKVIRKITPSGVVTTFAGSGFSGTINGIGTAASFSGPAGITVDTLGNIYVAESGSNTIAKITSDAVVTRIAGSGAQGFADGTGNAATFHTPYGIALGPDGMLYVADRYNHAIRKVTPQGVVTTLAGSGATGSVDAAGTLASFNNPVGLDVDLAGNLFVCDASNYKVRKVTSAGVVTTFAGNGNSGTTDGTGISAKMGVPKWASVDHLHGRLFVSDGGSIRILQ